MTFDVVIAGGTLVDGSGAPRTRADVGIEGGTITALGSLEGVVARECVDADGMHVAPGFIDSHVHSETVLLYTPSEPANLHQGVTTHVVGQDGFGFGPGNAATIAFSGAYLRPIYGEPATPFAPGGIGAYLAIYDGSSTVNVATLVPNGNLRLDVMGNAARAPAADELQAMQLALEEGMREGAVGLSSGLDYTPSGFASTAELAALARIAAREGGVYVSHVRYRLGLLAALSEAVEIGRLAECPVHISHLRPDPANGAGAEAVLELLADARRRGIDVTFDNYPYLYGCTFLAYLLPLWVREGSEVEVLARLGDDDVRRRLRAELESESPGWSEIAIAGTLARDRQHLLGLDVLTAAAGQGVDPVDFLCDLLVAERLDVMLLGVEATHPEAAPGLDRLMRDEHHMFGSDGIYREGVIHPRAYGGCAHFVGRLPEEGKLSLEEAVRHATSAPAERFGLAGRGRLAEGYAADIVVFDPAGFADRATRTQPRESAAGVRDVWVNGVAAMRNGSATGATPGRALKRGVR